MRLILLISFSLLLSHLTAQAIGDVIVTEFLADPATTGDADGEYIELFNTTDAPIDMAGWIISDAGSDSHTIAALTIPARSFVVLCRNLSAELSCDLEISISLGNTDDEIFITAPNGVVTHSVTYSDGDEFGDGVAFELAKEADAVASGVSTGPNGGTDFVASTTSYLQPGGSTSGRILFASPGFAGNTMLPVDFMSVNAISTPKTTMIKWATAQESGNEFFAVERSHNGSRFNEIGRVIGSGNSAVEIAYEFEDEFPLEGVTYYRLRQVDFDGSTAFSRVVRVERAFSGITAFPNPASDRLFVRGANPSSAVVVLDLNGRQVKQVAQVADGIDVSTLRAGTYLLRVTTTTGTETIRFVRQ